MSGWGKNEWVGEDRREDGGGEERYKMMERRKRYRRERGFRQTIPPPCLGPDQGG